MCFPPTRVNKTGKTSCIMYGILHSAGLSFAHPKGSNAKVQPQNAPKTLFRIRPSVEVVRKSLDYVDRFCLSVSAGLLAFSASYMFMSTHSGLVSGLNVQKKSI